MVNMAILRVAAIIPIVNLLPKFSGKYFKATSFIYWN